MRAIVTGPLTRRTNRNAALALASFGALLAFLDVTIVNVAFPSIRQSFPHASLGDLSWVLNAYNIVFAALLVAAGRLADVFGRRRMFTVGIVVFTVASVLCAAADSVALLIGWRVLQAIGAGLVVPASLALVVEAFPADHRSHAVGLWGATAAFAAGIGPPLGGALVDLDNWRLAFLVNVPLGVAAVAATGRILIESRAPGRRRLPDLRGATVLGLAIAVLTLAIVQGPTWGWTSPAVLGCFAATPLLLAGFVESSRRHPVPVLDAELLRIRTFTVANIATFVAGMGFYAYLLDNILWLHYVWHWSLVRSGLGVAPGAVVAAVVAGLLGRVADARGARLVAVPGALVWAAAYVWYAVQVPTSPHFLSAWLPGQILSGIGVGATLPVMASAALAAVPGARYATASAVVSGMRQLGGVLGVALLVVIVGSPSPASAASAFRHGWVLSIACFAATAVVALGLRRTAAGAHEAAPAPAAPKVDLAAPEVASSTPTHAAAFERLPERARQRLLAGAEVVTVEGGAWLFHEGDATDALYVVKSGRLDVVSGGGLVRELSGGDVVGELGAITGAPRSAGVRARRDSVLWRVTPSRLDSALRRDPAVARAVIRSLAEQLQEQHATTTHTGDRQPTVVAVVAAGARADTVRRVADLLHDGLAAHLRVVSAESMTVDTLHALEPRCDRVLLVCPGANRSWHRFCLRQADRVVLVAAADTAPDAALRAQLRDGYVVLVGEPPSPELLREWYAAVDPRFVFRATDETLPDVMASVAARLAGRSIGVAIAGGGARSIAGIGVLEELIARGFTIDRLAGCSVGAVVAAFYATGRDATAVDAVVFEEFVRRNPFNDYRIPKVSLVRGRKTEAAIARYFTDVRFEDLPRELVLVSTDLLRRELVVHRRGSVGEALRASLSLPGLYPPARIADTLHVDGGILDNLPTDPLVDRGEGPVIGVNIAAASSVSAKAGPPRMPGLGETLMRTILMAGASALDRSRERATVVVTPDTRGIGLLEFHQIDRAREAGRAAGAAAADALDSLLAADAPPPAVVTLPAPRRASGTARSASRLDLADDG